MKRTYAEHMKAKDRACLGRWVLLSGQEQQLKRELVEQIRREARAASPGDEPSWEVLEGPSATAKDVLARGQTAALFGGARVVLVREADRIDEDEQTALAKAVKPLPETVAVVLVTGESRDRRPRDLRAPLRKAITHDGLAIDCPAMKGGDAVEWVTQQARKRGKRIEQAAAHKLVEQKVGTSLGALEAEVEKLALYVGDRDAITAANVDEVTPRLLEEDVFRLLTAVARGETGHAVDILRGLLQEKRGAPGAIYWQLAQSLRELWQIKLLTEHGWRPGKEPDEEVMELLPRDPRKNALARLRGNRAWLLSRLVGQAQSIGWGRLSRAFEALRGCDFAIKGISGKVGEPETALELLVVQLCTGVDLPVWRSPEGERRLG